MIAVSAPAFTVETHPSRETWIEARRAGIGGSDAAVLWGVSPYDDLLGLYVSKVVPTTGGAEDASEWLEIGTEMEPVCATLYARRTDSKLHYPGPTTILRSVRWPWMCVSIDRIVSHRPGFDGPGVLECKNRGIFNVRDWNAGLPLEVTTQVQHALAVTGYGWASPAAVLGGNRFRFVDVMRDEEFIEMHVEKCRVFWEEHVVHRVPPAAGIGKETAEALKKLYAKESGEVVQLPAEAEDWAFEREEAKLAEKAAKARIVEMENKIKAAIGHATVAALPSGAGEFTLKTVEKKAYSVKPQSYRELRWKAAKEK